MNESHDGCVAMEQVLFLFLIATLFGNRIDRPVDFEKSLKELNGLPVRMKLELWDCDLYSFCFTSNQENEGVSR